MDLQQPHYKFVEQLTLLVKTPDAAQRLRHTTTLIALLKLVTPADKAKLATLTVHTISQLFTLDQAAQSGTRVWSRHPSHTEPLLEALMALLSLSLSHIYSVAEAPSENPLPSLSDLLLTPAEKDLDPLPLRSTTLYPHHVLPSSDQISRLQAAFAEVPRSLQLSTAHLLQLLTTLADERSVSLRRSALQALSALCRALYPPTLASFLPGLVSALAKLLSKGAELHSSVALAALDAFHCLLTAGFPEPEQRAPHWSFNLFKQQTGSHSNREEATEPAQRGEPQMHVERDDAWIGAASEQASLRVYYAVASKSGPLFHATPRVRAQVAHFILGMLRGDAGMRLSASAVFLLRVALFSLCGDDYPVVRDAALAAMKSLLKSKDIDLWDVERGVRALVRLRGDESREWQDGGGKGSGAEKLRAVAELDDAALRTLTECADDMWVRLASGYLAVMVPTHVDVKQVQEAEYVIRRDSLPGCLTRIGPDVFCKVLMDLLEHRWVVMGDSDEAIAHSLGNSVLRAGRLLGKSGLLMSVFSTLESRARLPEEEEQDPFDAHQEANIHSFLSSFKQRGIAVLVLQSVVRGAISRTDIPDAQLQAHRKQVYECAKATLACMNGFFLPGIQSLASERVSLDDDVLAMKQSLLVCSAELFEDLADLHRRCHLRPLGADVTLVVLMSLLRDVSHGDSGIRRVSHDTVVRIARATGGSSERRLLLRHLNYIIGRVIRNLDKGWAGDVLSLVIGAEGDEVSREAINLLETTLQQMNDGLAGAGNDRALTTLACIENVLATAVKQKQDSGATLEGIRRRSEPHSLGGESWAACEKDFAELRKSLFLYCKDDIPNYSDLTGAYGRFNGSSHKDEQREGDDEDEDRPKDAFETMAIHSLNGARDLLVGRPWSVCAASLRCATLSVQLLKGRERLVLPQAAKLLPLVPDQFVVLNEELTAGEALFREFKRRKAAGREDGEEVEDLVGWLNSKGRELPVVQNACLLIAALGAQAGSFIEDGFVRLLYPKMRRLLRLAQCFPTLVTRGACCRECVATPSYGAMSAADACLEAIAAVSVAAPAVLGAHARSLVRYVWVFFDGRHDPGRAGRPVAAHTNRAMVRFECERWVRRRELADTIVRELGRVRGSEVLVTLLGVDRTAPQTVRGRRAWMHDIRVGPGGTQRSGA